MYLYVRTNLLIMGLSFWKEEVIALLMFYHLETRDYVNTVHM